MKKYLAVMGGTEYGYSRHNSEGIHRDYNKEADRLIKSAEQWGITCFKYDNNFILNSDYYKEHSDVLSKVSFGFAFRPIIIWDVLNKIENGDGLLFTDSNHIIAKDPQIFYDVLGKYGAFFRDHWRVKYLNRHWTRMDMFINGGFNEERYFNSIQIQGNIFGFKKDEKSLKYVKEWLELSLRPEVMFGKNEYSNFDGFREHRHDQSLMSLLREKYQYPYLVRNENAFAEFIIPEIEGITPNPEDIVNNSWRKEQDDLDNK